MTNNRSKAICGAWLLASLGVCSSANALDYGTFGNWDSQARRDAANASMRAVVDRFNVYGDFNWGSDGYVDVYYHPGVPTAQANYYGNITFGGTWPNQRVTQHELNHWLGSGTYWNWANQFDGWGGWTGPKVSQLVQQFDGDGARIYRSGSHFYGYGLNYDNEVPNSGIFMRNVALMYAMRQDMGNGNPNNPWSATNVTLTASDPRGTSAFNWFGGGYSGNYPGWSDRYFAHAGAAYSTGAQAIRTPEGFPSWTFAGDSLTVNAGGQLLYNGWGPTGVVTVRNLVLDGGTVRHDQFPQDLFQLGGHVELKSASTIDAANGDIAIVGTVGGPGSLTKTGPHTLTLTRPNFYTGLTHINQGTLAINGQWALGGRAYGGLSFNGGTLKYAANITGGNGGTDISREDFGAARPVTINAGGATIDTNGNNVIYANGIGNGGTGWLVKTGAGSLVLNGANSYTGGTLVRNGTLEVNHASSVIGATEDGINLELAVAAADNAAMVVRAGRLNADRVMVAGNVFNNDGGAATLTQTGGTINARRWFGVGTVGNGTFNLSGGTVNQNGAGGTQAEVAVFGAARGTLNISGSARLNLLNNANLSVGVVNNSGTGTVNQNGGTVTFYRDAGTAVGGSGRLVLGQNNPTGTYTYNLNGGTLTTGGVTRNASAAAAGATGVFNFNGGTLKAAGDNAAFMQGLSAAYVRAGGAKIDTAGKSVTIAQPLRNGGGTAGLTKSGAGTLTLSGANTYAGNTSVKAGMLRVTNTSGSATGAGTVFVSSGATFAGTGTVLGEVDVAAGGGLSPGGGVRSVGALNVGSLDLEPGSTFRVDLDPARSLADLLRSDTGIDLNFDATTGATNLGLTLMSAPALGQRFTVMRTENADALAGRFAQGSFADAAFNGANYRFSINYAANIDSGSRANDVTLTSVRYSASLSALVPEPSALALPALAAVAMMRRRRRGTGG